MLRSGYLQKPLLDVVDVKKEYIAVPDFMAETLGKDSIVLFPVIPEKLDLL